MRRGLLVVLVAAAVAAPAALAGARAAGPRQVQWLESARASGIANVSGTLYVRSGVGSLGALRSFSRNARTGRLAFLQCVARRVRGCTSGLGLETPAAIAGSPDGRSVYVAAANGRSVGIYARVRGGRLVPRGSVTGISRPRAVAVSPDGRNVYVGGDRLWTFRRAASGALTLAGTIAQQVRAVAVSPDGSTVYAAGAGGPHGQLVSYAREPDSGALTADVTLDSATTPGIQQPAELVALRDSVYLASTVSGAVTRFDAALRPLGIARGYPTAAGLAVTARYVYVAYRDGLGVLSRQLGRQGSVRLTRATGVATAGPDVYVVSRDRVTAFRR